MLELSLQEHRIVTQKWIILILFVCKTNQKISYSSFKNILNIPNSTLIIKLNELVKYKYLQKFIYGSVSKPHYTEYQITPFGLDTINKLLSLRL